MAEGRPIPRFSHLARATLVMGLLGAVCAGWSYWRGAGRARIDQAWVPVPATGMAELRSMRRGWRVGDGRVEWFEEEFISAVVPQRTAVDNPATSSTEWIFAPVPPERDRALGSAWYFADWREWRAGSLGWYTPTGGAGSSRVVSVPLWPPAVLLCVPSVLLWLRRRGMSRRLRAGACWSCGYAGVGRQPGARCPECGAVRPA